MDRRTFLSSSAGAAVGALLPFSPVVAEGASRSRNTLFVLSAEDVAIQVAGIFEHPGETWHLINHLQTLNNAKKKFDTVYILGSGDETFDADLLAWWYHRELIPSIQEGGKLFDYSLISTLADKYYYEEVGHPRNYRISRHIE